MPEIVSETVSVYPFKVEAGRPWYLLLRRAPGGDNEGAWQAVHGHVDPGETSVETAARELYEETADEPVSMWSVDYVEQYYEVKSDRILLVPCFAALVSGPVVSSPEHDASRWLSHAEAVNLCTFENQRHALEAVHRDVASKVASGAEPLPALKVR